MRKKLGIIGGMGPLATVKLFEKIVLLTRANSDQEHLHILIDNNTSIADRTAYILNNNMEDPKPQLLESAKRLKEAGADFLIMPCNTAHNFYDYVRENVDIPFLNMIEETAKYIRKKHPELKKIGLLATDGTLKSEIYNKIFEEYGIEIIVPSIESQKYVHQLVYNIKEGIVQESLNGVYLAMDEIRSQDVDVFIAGCTEISVALDLYKLRGDFVDPLEVIGVSAIEFAGGKVKRLNK